MCVCTFPRRVTPRFPLSVRRNEHLLPFASWRAHFFYLLPNASVSSENTTLASPGTCGCVTIPPTLNARLNAHRQSPRFPHFVAFTYWERRLLCRSLLCDEAWIRDVKSSPFTLSHLVFLPRGLGYDLQQCAWKVDLCFWNQAWNFHNQMGFIVTRLRLSTERLSRFYRYLSFISRYVVMLRLHWHTDIKCTLPRGTRHIGVVEWYKDALSWRSYYQFVSFTNLYLFFLSHSSPT